MERILTQAQDELVRRERSVLEELRVHLTRLEATDEDLDLLKSSLHQLDELFLLVVVGEFNAGKTAFVNALLGDRILTEGVTPTTSQIHILRYGDTHQQSPANNGFYDDDLLIVQVPVEWLRAINLVDTPGVNAVVQQHQEITEHFVPRSDLVLFITSADRPFSESERTFLERVRQWGKKIVIVVNKIDLIQEGADRQQILDFVHENAQRLLRIEPQIFPVSARLALESKKAAKEGNEPVRAALWTQSHFGVLEEFILQSLDAEERLRLKLENPLGVADRLLNTYRAVMTQRRDLLGDDFQTLETIEEQLDAYQSDMHRDFKYHISHVDNVLYEMAERGDRFFDDKLRVTNIMSLINTEKLRGEFDREVVGETSRDIERQVSDLIDWLVDKDYQQWRHIMDYLGRRAAQHEDRMVGQIQSNFEMNRQSLLSSVGRDAQQVVDSYDRETESLKLSQQVQQALIQTAAVEAGALGLGALLVALLQTTLLDVTGILGASAVAALGFYVLPYRRTQIKQELRERINDLRSQLNDTMTRQFETELSDSVQRVREAIAPYTRFVSVERDKLARLEDDLMATQAELEKIRGKIAELPPATKQ